jgi:hypothetical protein
MLSDAAMEQVQVLVNNFSAMAPGQVRPLCGWRFGACGYMWVRGHAIAWQKSLVSAAGPGQHLQCHGARAGALAVFLADVACS